MENVLDNGWVRLEPLEPRHAEGLADAIRDGELWNIRETLVPHPDDLPAFFAAAEQARADGREQAYAVLDLAHRRAGGREAGRVVGCTRLMCIQRQFRRLEIGYTFYARSAQRTHVNTGAKYLLLRQAFEVWKMNRVELLTDFRNQKSRAAIARLGAREEGVLRSHMQMPDGHVRDSVLFAMVAEQWPEAKRWFEGQMTVDGPSPASPQ